MPSQRRAFHAFALPLLLLAAPAFLACASAKIQDADRYRVAPGFPRPEAVILYDFAGTEEELAHKVKADASADSNISEEKAKAIELAHAAAEVIATDLAAALRAKGILVAREGDDFPSGPSLVVDGHFLDVDEGSRLGRAVIGFGVGSTELNSKVQIYTLDDQGRRQIDAFDVTAKSGRMPGIATPLGVGAATGMMAGAVVAGAATAAKEVLGPLSGNAEDTAQQIADRIVKRFVDEGWLPKEVLDN